MKKQADPRMHSAEHILNQTMVRRYDCGRCFTAHIERKKSKCDYHFDHELTGDEVEEIQSRVNRVIKSDLPISETFVLKEKAQGLYDTGKLPDDVDGRVRIIHMGPYDACPCIGDHVTSTGEIGAFRITTTSFKDGVLRIRFKLSCNIQVKPQRRIYPG
jgi:misacylated tRNA(Ala) deacylase